MRITWNTDVKAPCCPGEIVADDGQTVLVQTDWDFPGVASSFGWDIASVAVERGCLHSGTDGTIRCPNCRLQPGDFIDAAREWLDDHDGATADDPGYFS